MGNTEKKCLDEFPVWLKTLGTDTQAMLDALKNKELGQDAKRSLAGGINYLFKSLDLIPDGIDDIGYLDDAFVMRVAVRNAKKNEEELKSFYAHR